MSDSSTSRDRFTLSLDKSSIIDCVPNWKLDGTQTFSDRQCIHEETLRNTNIKVRIYSKGETSLSDITQAASWKEKHGESWQWENKNLVSTYKEFSPGSYNISSKIELTTDDFKSFEGIGYTGNDSYIWYEIDFSDSNLSVGDSVGLFIFLSGLPMQISGLDLLKESGSSSYAYPKVALNTTAKDTSATDERGGFLSRFTYDQDDIYVYRVSGKLTSDKIILKPYIKESSEVIGTDSVEVTSEGIDFTVKSGGVLKMLELQFSELQVSNTTFSITLSCGDKTVTSKATKKIDTRSDWMTFEFDEASAFDIAPDSTVKLKFSSGFTPTLKANGTDINYNAIYSEAYGNFVSSQYINLLDVGSDVYVPLGDQTEYISGKFYRTESNKYKLISLNDTKEKGYFSSYSGTEILKTEEQSGSTVEMTYSNNNAVNISKTTIDNSGTTVEYTNPYNPKQEDIDKVSPKINISDLFFRTRLMDDTESGEHETTTNIPFEKALSYEYTGNTTTAYEVSGNSIIFGELSKEKTSEGNNVIYTKKLPINEQFSGFRMGAKSTKSGEDQFLTDYMYGQATEKNLKDNEAFYRTALKDLTFKITPSEFITVGEINEDTKMSSIVITSRSDSKCFSDTMFVTIYVYDSEDKFKQDYSYFKAADASVTVSNTLDKTKADIEEATAVTDSALIGQLNTLYFSFSEEGHVFDDKDQETAFSGDQKFIKIDTGKTEKRTYNVTVTSGTTKNVYTFHTTNDEEIDGNSSLYKILVSYCEENEITTSTDNVEITVPVVRYYYTPNKSNYKEVCKSETVVLDRTSDYGFLKFNFKKEKPSYTDGCIYVVRLDQDTSSSNQIGFGVLKKGTDYEPKGIERFDERAWLPAISLYFNYQTFFLKYNEDEDRTFDAFANTDKVWISSHTESEMEARCEGYVPNTQVNEWLSKKVTSRNVGGPYFVYNDISYCTLDQNCDPNGASESTDYPLFKKASEEGITVGESYQTDNKVLPQFSVNVDELLYEGKDSFESGSKIKKIELLSTSTCKENGTKSRFFIFNENKEYVGDYFTTQQREKRTGQKITVNSSEQLFEDYLYGKSSNEGVLNQEAYELSDKAEPNLYTDVSNLYWKITPSEWCNDGESNNGKYINRIRIVSRPDTLHYNTDSFIRITTYDETGNFVDSIDSDVIACKRKTNTTYGFLIFNFSDKKPIYKSGYTYDVQIFSKSNSQKFGFGSFASGTYETGVKYTINGIKKKNGSAATHLPCITFGFNFGEFRLISEEFTNDICTVTDDDKQIDIAIYGDYDDTNSLYQSMELGFSKEYLVLNENGITKEQNTTENSYSAVRITFESPDGTEYTGSSYKTFNNILKLFSKAEPSQEYLSLYKLAQYDNSESSSFNIHFNRLHFDKEISSEVALTIQQILILSSDDYYQSSTASYEKDGNIITSSSVIMNKIEGDENGVLIYTFDTGKPIDIQNDVLSIEFSSLKAKGLDSTADGLSYNEDKEVLYSSYDSFVGSSIIEDSTVVPIVEVVLVDNNGNEYVGQSYIAPNESFNSDYTESSIFDITNVGILDKMYNLSGSQIDYLGQNYSFKKKSFADVLATNFTFEAQNLLFNTDLTSSTIQLQNISLICNSQTNSRPERVLQVYYNGNMYFFGEQEETEYGIVNLLKYRYLLSVSPSSVIKVILPSAKYREKSIYKLSVTTGLCDGVSYLKEGTTDTEYYLPIKIQTNNGTGKDKIIKTSLKTTTEDEGDTYIFDKDIYYDECPVYDDYKANDGFPLERLRIVNFYDPFGSNSEETDQYANHTLQKLLDKEGRVYDCDDLSIRLNVVSDEVIAYLGTKDEDGIKCVAKKVKPKFINDGKADSYAYCYIKGTNAYGYHYDSDEKCYVRDKKVNSTEDANAIDLKTTTDYRFALDSGGNKTFELKEVLNNKTQGKHKTLLAKMCCKTAMRYEEGGVVKYYSYNDEGILLENDDLNDENTVDKVKIEDELVDNAYTYNLDGSVYETGIKKIYLGGQDDNGVNWYVNDDASHGYSKATLLNLILPQTLSNITYIKEPDDSSGEGQVILLSEDEVQSYCDASKTRYFVLDNKYYTEESSILIDGDINYDINLDNPDSVVSEIPEEDDNIFIGCSNAETLSTAHENNFVNSDIIKGSLPSPSVIYEFYAAGTEIESTLQQAIDSNILYQDDIDELMDSSDDVQGWTYLADFTRSIYNPFYDDNNRNLYLHARINKDYEIEFAFFKKIRRNSLESTNVITQSDASGDLTENMPQDSSGCFRIASKEESDNLLFKDGKVVLSANPQFAGCIIDKATANVKINDYITVDSASLKNKLNVTYKLEDFIGHIWTYWYTVIDNVLYFGGLPLYNDNKKGIISGVEADIPETTENIKGYSSDNKLRKVLTYLYGEYDSSTEEWERDTLSFDVASYLNENGDFNSSTEVVNKILCKVVDGSEVITYFNNDIRENISCYSHHQYVIMYDEDEEKYVCKKSAALIENSEEEDEEEQEEEQEGISALMVSLTQRDTYIHRDKYDSPIYYGDGWFVTTHKYKNSISIAIDTLEGIYDEPSSFINGDEKVVVNIGSFETLKKDIKSFYSTAVISNISKTSGNLTYTSVSNTNYNNSSLATQVLSKIVAPSFDGIEFTETAPYSESHTTSVSENSILRVYGTDQQYGVKLKSCGDLLVNTTQVNQIRSNVTVSKEVNSEGYYSATFNIDSLILTNLIDSSVSSYTITGDYQYSLTIIDAETGETVYENKSFTSSDDDIAVTSLNTNTRYKWQLTTKATLTNGSILYDVSQNVFVEDNRGVQVTISSETNNEIYKTSVNIDYTNDEYGFSPTIHISTNDTVGNARYYFYDVEIVSEKPNKQIVYRASNLKDLSVINLCDYNAEEDDKTKSSKELQYNRKYNCLLNIRAYDANGEQLIMSKTSAVNNNDSDKESSFNFSFIKYYRESWTIEQDCSYEESFKMFAKERIYAISDDGSQWKPQFKWYYVSDDEKKTDANLKINATGSYSKEYNQQNATVGSEYIIESEYLDYTSDDKIYSLNLEYNRYTDESSGIYYIGFNKFFHFSSYSDDFILNSEISDNTLNLIYSNQIEKYRIVIYDEDKNVYYDEVSDLQKLSIDVSNLQKDKSYLVKVDATRGYDEKYLNQIFVMSIEGENWIITPFQTYISVNDVTDNTTSYTYTLGANSIPDGISATYTWTLYNGEEYSVIGTEDTVTVDVPTDKTYQVYLRAEIDTGDFSVDQISLDGPSGTVKVFVNYKSFNRSNYTASIQWLNANFDYDSVKVKPAYSTVGHPELTVNGNKTNDGTFNYNVTYRYSVIFYSGGYEEYNIVYSTVVTLYKQKGGGSIISGGGGGGTTGGGGGGGWNIPVGPGPYGPVGPNGPGPNHKERYATLGYWYISSDAIISKYNNTKKYFTIGPNTSGSYSTNTTTTANLVLSVGVDCNDSNYTYTLPKHDESDISIETCLNGICSVAGDNVLSVNFEKDSTDTGGSWRHDHLAYGDQTLLFQNIPFGSVTLKYTIEVSGKTENSWDVTSEEKPKDMVNTFNDCGISIIKASYVGLSLKRGVLGYGYYKVYKFVFDKKGIRTSCQPKVKGCVSGIKTKGVKRENNVQYNGIANQIMSIGSSHIIAINNTNYTGYTPRSKSEYWEVFAIYSGSSAANLYGYITIQCPGHATYAKGNGQYVGTWEESSHYEESVSGSIIYNLSAERVTPIVCKHKGSDSIRIVKAVQ